MLAPHLNHPPMLLRMAGGFAQLAKAISLHAARNIASSKG
jgi:hypothetical protein